MGFKLNYGFRVPARIAGQPHVFPYHWGFNGAAGGKDMAGIVKVAK